MILYLIINKSTADALVEMEHLLLTSFPLEGTSAPLLICYIYAQREWDVLVLVEIGFLATQFNPAWLLSLTTLWFSYVYNRLPTTCKCNNRETDRDWHPHWPLSFILEVTLSLEKIRNKNSPFPTRGKSKVYFFIKKWN